MTERTLEQQEYPMESLRDARNRRGMSLRGLSRRSGVALSGLQVLETSGEIDGKPGRIARLDVVRRISLTLDVNPFLVTELNAALEMRCTSKSRV